MQVTTKDVIQKPGSNRVPHDVSKFSSKLGTKLCVLHKSKELVDPEKWLEATVLKAMDHFVLCKGDD